MRHIQDSVHISRTLMNDSKMTVWIIKYLVFWPRCHATLYAVYLNENEFAYMMGVAFKLVTEYTFIS